MSWPQVRRRGRKSDCIELFSSSVKNKTTPPVRVSGSWVEGSWRRKFEKVRASQLVLAFLDVVSWRRFWKGRYDTPLAVRQSPHPPTIIIFAQEKT